MHTQVNSATSAIGSSALQDLKTITKQQPCSIDTTTSGRAPPMSGHQWMKEQSLQSLQAAGFNQAALVQQMQLCKLYLAKLVGLKLHQYHIAAAVLDWMPGAAIMERRQHHGVWKDKAMFGSILTSSPHNLSYESMTLHYHFTGLSLFLVFLRRRLWKLPSILSLYKQQPNTARFLEILGFQCQHSMKSSECIGIAQTLIKILSTLSAPQKPHNSSPSW